MAGSLNVTKKKNDIDIVFDIESAARLPISISFSTSKGPPVLRHKYRLSDIVSQKRYRYRSYRFDIVFQNDIDIVHIVSISFISFLSEQKNTMVSRIFSRSCDVREVQGYFQERTHLSITT